jgi:acetoacetate decarboxylase
VVPEPLEVTGDTVAYEFIRMPDSTGFGDYTETGQVIPVRSPSGNKWACGVRASGRSGSGSGGVL